MKKRILLFALALLTAAACFVPTLPARAATVMVSSDALVAKMKAREGFSATPYWDNSHYSIGYGTTCPNDKVDYYQKHPMSREEAEAEFRKFLNRFETNVNNFAAKHNLLLKQHQFDALVSFTYNCGAGWMDSLSGYFNTAVRAGSIGEDLLYGMALYSTSGGQYILIGRRLWEANMYINGDYGEGEKGSYPDNYRWVFLNAGPGQVRYKICAFDTNHKAALPEAFSHIPTGKDAEGNTFLYEFGGWYTADGRQVTVLDDSLSQGQELYARWLDPQGDPYPEFVQTFPVQATVVKVDTTVNVRKTPETTNTNQAGTLNKGQQVTVLQEVQGEYISYCGSATWCKIGEEQYVHKYYLEYAKTGNEVQTETTAKITSLEVVKAPTQTVFTEQNISPDWEGSVLKATYEDGFVKALTVTRSMTSGFDPAKNGVQNVTVTYGGLKTAFPVTVQLESGWKQDVVGWYHLTNGAKDKLLWKQDSKGLCYLDENGYIAKDRWVQDAGGWRYADENGYALCNQWKRDSRDWCYLGADGYVVTGGWVRDDLGWRYVGEDGYPVGSLWVQDASGWRYAGADGYALCNQWKQDSVGWVYLGADGYMVRNTWALDQKGWRYMGANGYPAANCWTQDQNGIRYAGAEGYMVINKWLKDKPGWRYIGADGLAVQNRWVRDSKDWCYLNAQGYMATSTWVQDQNGWRYVGANGYPEKNKWLKDKLGWCYLGADGYTVKNAWRKDSKGWCYLGADGYMATNTWAPDSVGWCYVGSNGYMVYNKWVLDGNRWRYVGANGYMLQNAWQKDSVGWCYLGADGYQVIDTVVADSKGNCYIGKNGYWDGKYI